jgi:hypothetical protein
MTATVWGELLQSSVLQKDENRSGYPRVATHPLSQAPGNHKVLGIPAWMALRWQLLGPEI